MLKYSSILKTNLCGCPRRYEYTWMGPQRQKACRRAQDDLTVVVSLAASTISWRKCLLIPGNNYLSVRYIRTSTYTRIHARLNLCLLVITLQLPRQYTLGGHRWFYAKAVQTLARGCNAASESIFCGRPRTFFFQSPTLPLTTKSEVIRTRYLILQHISRWIKYCVCVAFQSLITVKVLSRTQYHSAIMWRAVYPANRFFVAV